MKNNHRSGKLSGKADPDGIHRFSNALKSGNMNKEDYIGVKDESIDSKISRPDGYDTVVIGEQCHQKAGTSQDNHRTGGTDNSTV